MERQAIDWTGIVEEEQQGCATKPLADRWIVYDNSDGPSQKIAEGNLTEAPTVYVQQTWQQIIRRP